ncbi:MAG: hypothetical protein QM775_31690 [Pirellulales bacterium]
MLLTTKIPVAGDEHSSLDVAELQRRSSRTFEEPLVERSPTPVAPPQSAVSENAVSA